MATEGELRSNNMDDSDRVRELQEQVAELKAEVNWMYNYEYIIVKCISSYYIIRLVETGLLDNYKIHTITYSLTYYVFKANIFFEVKHKRDMTSA